MSSPNKDKNALEVLADTASDDELRNRYDASKHSGRSSSENRDHYSTSSDTKEDDDSGGRGCSADDDMNSSIRKAASKAKKEGLRKGKWMVSKNMLSDRCIPCPYMPSNNFSYHLLSAGGGRRIYYKGHPSLQFRPHHIA